MASESRQELVLDNTFSSHPLYSHRDARYQAYKVLIKQIAERLVEEDLKKIIHFCDLPSTTNSSDSLGILTLLEKKGQFSYTNVDPLKDLLRKSDRCDLVSQFVDPFSRTRHRSTYSLPPGNLGGYSTAYEASCPTANGNVETSWPYNRGQRYRTWTPGSFSRPSSRPNLSSVTEDVFLPPPTDALPPGLTQPRAASLLHTPSHAMLQGYHDREEQEFPSSCQMSLSFSAQFPSQSLLASNSSIHETTSMPAERSELALHHQSSVISMLPPNNSAQSLSQPAEMSAAQFTSCASTSDGSGLTSSAPQLKHNSQDNALSGSSAATDTPVSVVFSRYSVKVIKMSQMIRKRKAITLKSQEMKLGGRHNPRLHFELKSHASSLEESSTEYIALHATLDVPSNYNRILDTAKFNISVTMTDHSASNTPLPEPQPHYQEFTLVQEDKHMDFTLFPHSYVLNSRRSSIDLVIEVQVIYYKLPEENVTDYEEKNPPEILDFVDIRKREESSSPPTLSDLKINENPQVVKLADEAVAKQMSSSDILTCTEKRAHALKSIVISDLTFGDLIARGGQAAVWKGLWEGKNVAIKKYTNQPDPRDINVLQELPSHDNIVMVYGVVIDKFSCCIVMKLMNGGSLHDFIYKKKSIPSSQQRFSWMKDIAIGMEFLHSKGIAHRDLKSGNVLLAEDARKTAKLCDFGTARLLEHTTVQSTITGTYRWMAPEIIKSAHARINMKCDVFSYSMVLCEIVTLELPFKEAETDQMALVALVAGKRPSLPQSDTECCPFLRRLITACWSEDPADRPSFKEINLSLNKETFPR